MSEFKDLNLSKPATLRAVVEAVVHLSAYDESQVLELVSAGKLQELFPFRPAKSQEPIPDFVPEHELIEASPLPLNAEQRTRLIESSLPPSSSRAPVRRAVIAKTKRSSGESVAAFVPGKKSKR